MVRKRSRRGVARQVAGFGRGRAAAPQALGDREAERTPAAAVVKGSAGACLEMKPTLRNLQPSIPERGAPWTPWRVGPGEQSKGWIRGWGGTANRAFGLLSISETRRPARSFHWIGQEFPDLQLGRPWRLREGLRGAALAPLPARRPLRTARRSGVGGKTLVLREYAARRTGKAPRWNAWGRAQR